MTKPNWHGVYPAATTHFHPDYSLNLPAFQTHLDQMIKAGVHGMVVLGSVGENTAHDYDEKMTVLAAAKEAIAGRVPVLSGVAENTTAQACRFAEAGRKAGLAGMQPPPPSMGSRITAARPAACSAMRLRVVSMPLYSPSTQSKGAFTGEAPWLKYRVPP